MSVERPFDIYQEQLTSQYHGVALWRPNPVENVHDQVSIGVKAGLPAVTDGFPSSSSSEPHRAVRTSPKSLGTSRFPPSLTAQDKAKFTQYFSKYSPVDGLLLGTCMSFWPQSRFWSQYPSQAEKAREVFVKSKLPVEQLSQIWFVLFSFSQVTYVLMCRFQESIGYSESWIVGCCRLHRCHVSHPGFHVRPTPFYPNYSPSWLV